VVQRRGVELRHHLVGQRLAAFDRESVLGPLAAEGRAPRPPPHGSGGRKGLPSPPARAGRWRSRRRAPGAARGPGPRRRSARTPVTNGSPRAPAPPRRAPHCRSSRWPAAAARAARPPGGTAGCPSGGAPCGSRRRCRSRPSPTRRRPPRSRGGRSAHRAGRTVVVRKPWPSTAGDGVVESPHDVDVRLVGQAAAPLRVPGVGHLPVAG